jgi:hypothetical protein
MRNFSTKVIDILGRRYLPSLAWRSLARLLFIPLRHSFPSSATFYLLLTGHELKHRICDLAEAAQIMSKEGWDAIGYPGSPVARLSN